MDYRRFLRAPTRVTLPSFGERWLEAPGRRLRLAEPVASGWWAFEVDGRNARAIERAEADGVLLGSLPVVWGHFTGDRLAFGSGRAEEVHFLPSDRPAELAPVNVRRWPSGQLVFDALDFETEVDLEARERLEDGRSLADLRAVTPSLRAAFGHAVVAHVAEHLAVPVAPLEVEAHVARIAEHRAPRAEAEELLHRLEALRVVEEAHRRRVTRGTVLVDREVAADQRPGARVERALEAAGATLLALRSAGDLLEVTYRFAGERFITLVERETLHVVDAGVCLAGRDELVTLHSLPGVIRQAVDEGRLVITRRARAP